MKVDDINDKPPHHIETFTEGEGGGSRADWRISLPFLSKVRDEQQSVQIVEQ